MVSPDCFRHTLQTGLCYGKLEAGVLTFIIPTFLLGHLVFFLQFIHGSSFSKMMTTHIYTIIIQRIDQFFNYYLICK